MKLNIALLPGDGIGPEVIEQAVKVSNAIAKKFNHKINWMHASYRSCSYRCCRRTLSKRDT